METIRQNQMNAVNEKHSNRDVECLQCANKYNINSLKQGKNQ